MNLLKLAQRLANLVEAEASRVPLPVTFCAVDMHGNVILKQRMDGAKLVSIEMSERKAYTAVAIDMKTEDMTALAVPGGALYTFPNVAGGRHTVFGGGVPLHIDGAFIGIGVSGGTTEQDIASRVLEPQTARPPAQVARGLPPRRSQCHPSARSISLPTRRA